MANLVQKKLLKPNQQKNPATTVPFHTHKSEPRPNTIYCQNAHIQQNICLAPVCFFLTSI